MKQKIRKMKRFLAFLLVAVMAAGIFNVSGAVMVAAETTSATEAEGPVNLFDKNSDDIWLQALSYRGSKLANAANYANLFTTHKIEVVNGDILYWGGFGKENYVAELYDANDNYLGQIAFASTNHVATGNTVAGVKGTIVDEYLHSYTISNENAGYVRILGNISTMDDFQVYLNLENGFDSWPREDTGEDTDTELVNLFNKDDSDVWLKALSYNGKKLSNTSSYANIFTTHKIEVANGDTIYWGGFGQENYVMELYDANDNFLKQIQFTETIKEATGNTVTGVGNSTVAEYLHSYTINNENAGYVRILGNISTIDDYKVYLNLPNGFDDWPGRPDKINVYEDMEALVYTDESGATMPYRLYVPDDYDAAKSYPVLLFFHGAGERGNDNQSQLVNTIQPLFDNQEELREAIVIAPQCPAGKRWVETDWTLGNYDSDAIQEEQLAIVCNILAEVQGQYTTDNDRIYALGLSMGGIATWNLLMNHGDMFAAAIPICGAADLDKAILLVDIPIWTFHGTLDPTVPYQATVDMVNAIKAAGGNKIKFTTYPGAYHAIWNTVAAEEGLIEWLFSHRLSDRNAPDNLFDKNHYDNWKQALTYNGEKLVNTLTYANIFTTHPIEVQCGDVLDWGSFGKELYTMEVYDADGNFLRQVKFTETTSTALGTTVAGVGGTSVEEYRHSYAIVDETAAYVRILGNISTIDSFMVFKNLEANGQTWPGSYQSYKSILTGRSVLFAGDSITNAVKDDGGRSGWAGRIGEDNGMVWINAGVSGASASTCRGSNRVINQLAKYVGISYDYLILHAGVNDAMDSVEIGEMTDSYVLEDFDTATFAGGLEELFYYACKNYEGAKIGYIVNYATPNSTWGGSTKDMSAYFAVAKQICDKWCIPYIDLYEGTIIVNGEELSYSYDIINVLDSEAFYNDDAGEVHIGGVGYDRISPYIAEWMKTLPVTDTDIVKDNNVAGEGTAYAQTTLGSYVASRLNDDSNSALWIAQTNAVPVYCGISFENAVNVYALQLVAETRETLGANVMDYYIEAKTADGAWETIYTGDTYDEEAQSYTTNITLENIVTTDDIRVTFTSNGGIYPALAEIRIYAKDDIEGDHVHSWSEWVEVKAPTYEEDGLKERTCECGEVQQEAIPKLVFQITKQPEDVMVKKGEKAEVTVEATGDGLTYTWYYKNPGNKKFYVSSSAFITGEAGNTYSIPMYAWRDGQEVYCVVTDANGTTLQSNIVTLSMDPGPVIIVKQPEDAAVDSVGKHALVTVQAKGKGLTYTWYYKNPGNVKFYKSGAAYVNENQYMIEVYNWRDGQQVYCVITDENGATLQTNTVTLSIAK